MNAAILLAKAAVDGCEIYLGDSCALKIRGTAKALERWRPRVKEHTDELLAFARSSEQGSLDFGGSDGPRAATAREIVELARLVNVVYRSSPLDYRERAVMSAFGQPEAALLSYRLLADAFASSLSGVVPQDEERADR